MTRNNNTARWHVEVTPSKVVHQPGYRVFCIFIMQCLLGEILSRKESSVLSLPEISLYSATLTLTTKLMIQQWRYPNHSLVSVGVSGLKLVFRQCLRLLCFSREQVIRSLVPVAPLPLPCCPVLSTDMFEIVPAARIHFATLWGIRDTQTWFSLALQLEVRKPGAPYTSLASNAPLDSERLVNMSSESELVL
jgi:hypothetical protein